MADRLYRSRDDRMLAGVAGGVAETLDLDPSLVRIAWAVLAIFTGGVAFVVYVVMAIVVPEAPVEWAASSPATPATPAAPGTANAPDNASAGYAAPGAPGAPGVPPVQPAAPPPGVGWSSAAAAGTPPSWTTERDTRRAARRARRDARGSGRGGLIAGFVLIAIGGVFLIREFIPWFDWNVWWPIGLIAIGGLLLVLALRPGSPAE